MLLTFTLIRMSSLILTPLQDAIFFISVLACSWCPVTKSHLGDSGTNLNERKLQFCINYLHAGCLWPISNKICATKAQCSQAHFSHHFSRKH